MMWRTEKNKSLISLCATLKFVSGKQFRDRRTESSSFEMCAPHEKSSLAALKACAGGLLALRS